MTDPVPSKKLDVYGPREQTYLEWRRRDDSHQDQPWALYLVAGNKDAWHLLNAPAQLEIRGAAPEPAREYPDPSDSV
jgi:hypothetical protein